MKPKGHSNEQIVNVQMQMQMQNENLPFIYQKLANI